jgi:succinoglycan biosynthesis transport protein ExoP
MRFALWRAVKGRASLRRTVKTEVVAPVPAPALQSPRALPPSGDLDLREIWLALKARRNLIIMPTLLAMVISLAAVNMISPRYKSEARILIDGRENVFLRPNAERAEERNALDPEAVTSQVQLLLSRDLARQVIKKNGLAERPEFDPVLQGLSPLKSLLALFGIGRDPFSLTPEERVLDAYFDRLTAYAVDKSRVVVIEFQSRDPDLAARVANSIAEGYLVLQQNARQEQAKAAGQWLSGEIDGLRKKVADAESRVEDFRSKSSLFIGTNNTTLSNQQLGELNSQLNNARALKSDAESKSRMIREMLQTGKPIEASEVLNSELIRRLSEQRVTLRAQLAEQSSTLLDAHPRIKELKAQLGDLDRQLREEAGKLSRALDNDSRIANGRVEGLSASLEQLKRQATSSNGQDVQLRALDREAKAQRDLLESYLAKYREATTRENIDAAPADGRIISRAIVSNTPAYPKKLPIVLIATLATLMLSAGGIATSELLRMTAPRPASFTRAEPVAAPTTSAAAVVAPPLVPRGEPMPALSEPVQPRVEPVLAETHPELATSISEIEKFAAEMRAGGEGARKIVVLGTSVTENVTLTALTLARLLARQAKVAIVDLSEASSTLTAVSNDPAAPGLAELMLGEASFGQVITRDRLSGVHMVSAGRAGFDRTLLQSPRMTLAVDALLRVYDHVVLDAGTASDLPAALLTTQGRAVLVPDASMNAAACGEMAEQLKAVGFMDVSILREPAQQAASAHRAPQVVAA